MLIVLLAVLLQDAPPKPVPPLCAPDAVEQSECLRPLDDPVETTKPGAPGYGFQNYPRDEAIRDAVNAQREAEEREAGDLDIGPSPQSPPPRGEGGPI
ncbi:hypothetical protein [Hyphobacterium marinum]|uniref:Uncharacterized protein n=1 Tax=Hyphobacterium marinum TaxID=3116574 RepID=A0ABU7LWQ6_9PROT|nr:hypothetical protein [Hyphobacterium sp. Y6023]MEE2565983.1 hypothetical protein [Hyphobacterium sp. Y6023]